MTTTTERFHTTVTERAGFRSCRRRWYYETVERLARKNQVPWHLVFGEAAHTALAEYYLAFKKKPHPRKKVLMEAFEAAWVVEDSNLQEQYGSFYDMGIGEEWNRWKNLGFTMFDHYDQFEREQPFFASIIAVNVEERSFVDILDPDGEHQDDLPLLSGRIDLVGERKDGSVWIMDHKTAQQTPHYAALDVDDQITGYCYIWWRTTGDVPRGCYYNVLVKEPPHPPKVLKDGSLSRDKSQRTTHALYLKAVHDLGFKAKDYAEILEILGKVGWSRFFVRDGSERNLDELHSFERRLFFETADMRRALLDWDLLYPNMSQWNCQQCSVLPLCRTEEEQGDVQYLIDNMHEELEPRHKIPEEVLSSEWKGVEHAGA